MAIKKILVTDDILVEQEKLKQILMGAGYEVVTASSGKEAIDKIAGGFKPDLIFMDIVMPEVDGFTACRKIANDEATRDIPVIFCSSKDEEADKVWAQLQGGKAYITKPYEKAEILDQIKVFNR